MEIVKKRKEDNSENTILKGKQAYNNMNIR